MRDKMVFFFLSVLLSVPLCEGKVCLPLGAEVGGWGGSPLVPFPCQKTHPRN